MPFLPSSFLPPPYLLLLTKLANPNRARDPAGKKRRTSQSTGRHTPSTVHGDDDDGHDGSGDDGISAGGQRARANTLDSDRSLRRSRYAGSRHGDMDAMLDMDEQDLRDSDIIPRRTSKKKLPPGVGVAHSSGSGGSGAFAATPWLSHEPFLLLLLPPNHPPHLTPGCSHSLLRLLLFFCFFFNTCPFPSFSLSHFPFPVLPPLCPLSSLSPPSLSPLLPVFPPPPKRCVRGTRCNATVPARCEQRRGRWLPAIKHPRARARHG